MKRINSFEEFNMLSEGIMAGTTGIMGEPKLNKAAELIGSYINRKVGGDFKKFPFLTYYNGVPGIMFYSNKNDTAFRVSGRGTERGPGIVGQLDWFEQFYDTKATFSITSEEFPIIQLVGEFAKLIKDKKYAKEAMNESALFEGELYEGRKSLTPDEIRIIGQKLANGESGKKIAVEIGIPYGQILKIKRGEVMIEKSDPTVKRNEETLDDKVLFLEETMNDIYDISRAVAAGAFNSLLISGRAGTGKTYSVDRAMADEGLVEGDDWMKISGAVSTIMMYKVMYQFKTKVLVFDDCDAVFSNEDGRNILKTALDTKKIRKVSYMKKLKMLYDPKDYDNDPEGEFNAVESGLIPNRFDFSGRVIFISNLSKQKIDPDGAIRSRSILVDVNPDDATLMERLKVLLPHLDPVDMPLADKEEIYEFMKSAKDVSMRTFVKAAGFKVAGLGNWQRMAKRYL